MQHLCATCRNNGRSTVTLQHSGQHAPPAQVRLSVSRTCLSSRRHRPVTAAMSTYLISAARNQGPGELLLQTVNLS
eukprot:jgi/Chrzof1/8876/Cz03g27190.t1